MYISYKLRIDLFALTILSVCFFFHFCFWERQRITHGRAGCHGTTFGETYAYQKQCVSYETGEEVVKQAYFPRRDYGDLKV
jgi:ABC-type branched-subunit amino acid transport system permease subunit